MNLDGGGRGVSNKEDGQEEEEDEKGKRRRRGMMKSRGAANLQWWDHIRRRNGSGSIVW